MTQSKPATGGSVTARLTAFLRNGPTEVDTYAPRPNGPLIWLNLPDDMPIGPVRELCKSLCQRIDDATCLLTVSDVSRWQGLEGAIVHHLPPDQNASIDRFLTHWQPDILLWADRFFNVRILQRTKAKNTPMFLINFPVLDLSRRSMRRSVTNILGQFTAAQVVSNAAAERLTELGFPFDKIEQVLPISEMTSPLKDLENRRRTIAGNLGPRLVWCAAHLRMRELSLVSDAHKQARKSFPTVALIVVPAAGETASEFVEYLADEGWKVSLESSDTPIDPQTEVLVTDGPDELGMWYRLSSVSLMGGSLNGPGSCNPFEAAALGSAVVCGPITFPFGARYRQLAKGDALVRVDDMNELGQHIITTLAPDRSAALATAAWTVGSEGVEAINQIVDLTVLAVTPEAS